MTRQTAGTNWSVELLVGIPLQSTNTTEPKNDSFVVQVQSWQRRLRPQWQHPSMIETRRAWCNVNVSFHTLDEGTPSRSLKTSTLVTIALKERWLLLKGAQYSILNSQLRASQ